MDLWERLKDYLRAPSLIFYHANTACHHTRMHNFSIVGSEVITRTIKETMYIRVNDSSLNRNIGKLSYIWDEVLFNTPALHLR